MLMNMIMMARNIIMTMNGLKLVRPVTLNQITQWISYTTDLIMHGTYVENVQNDKNSMDCSLLSSLCPLLQESNTGTTLSCISDLINPGTGEWFLQHYKYEVDDTLVSYDINTVMYIRPYKSWHGWVISSALQVWGRLHISIIWYTYLQGCNIELLRSERFDLMIDGTNDKRSSILFSYLYTARKPVIFYPSLASSAAFIAARFSLILARALFLETGRCAEE